MPCNAHFAISLLQGLDKIPHKDIEIKQMEKFYSLCILARLSSFAAMKEQVQIIDCNFKDPKHTKALVGLMNHYMSDAMGNHPEHSPESAQRLIEGLDKHPNKVIVFALYQGEFVGLCNSFVSFSTFAAKPFINIHDVIVTDKYRGLGVGRKMLEGVADRARALGCSKITLEVREDNHNAKHLYNSLGFKENDPRMHFWEKYL